MRLRCDTRVATERIRWGRGEGAGRLGFLNVFGGMLIGQAHGNLSLTSRFSGVARGRAHRLNALAVSLGTVPWQHVRETAKAVKRPGQAASTPLKRGVNESLACSTQNVEEPPLATEVALL